MLSRLFRSSCPVPSFDRIKRQSFMNETTRLCVSAAEQTTHTITYVRKQLSRSDVVIDAVDIIIIFSHKTRSVSYTQKFIRLFVSIRSRLLPRACERTSLSIMQALRDKAGRTQQVLHALASFGGQSRPGAPSAVAPRGLAPWWCTRVCLIDHKEGEAPSIVVNSIAIIVKVRRVSHE